MKKPLEIQTVIIPSGDNQTPGTTKCSKGGALFLIISATAGFGMEFDSGIEFQTKAGFVFGGDQFNEIRFFNRTPNPIIVQFYIGQVGVSYVGAYENREAPTYMKGSFGIVTQADASVLTAGRVNSVSIPTGGRGSNYRANDLLTVAGGVLATGGNAAQILVTAVDTNGGIKGYTLASKGAYSTNPASPNAVTGGSGTGASFNLSLVAPKVLFTVNGDQSLTLAANNTYTIDNFDGANRRKHIVFHVISGTLRIFDMNGALCRKITSGNVEIYDTDGQCTIDGNGSNVQFIPMEIYYS